MFMFRLNILWYQMKNSINFNFDLFEPHMNFKKCPRNRWCHFMLWIIDRKTEVVCLQFLLNRSPLFFSTHRIHKSLIQRREDTFNMSLSDSFIELIHSICEVQLKVAFGMYKFCSFENESKHEII